MTPMSPLIRAHRAAAGDGGPPLARRRRLPARAAAAQPQPGRPVEPPPEGLREAMAEMVRAEANTHLYGPVLGLPALRSEIAWRWSALYGGDIRPDEVAITAGCNQAFCTAVTTLAGPGDAVMLPVPWYFNHKMWLDMAGIETVPLACGAGHAPRPGAARALMSRRSQGDRARHPEQPHRRRVPARAHRRVRRHRARSRRGADPRRDLPRLPGPRRPAARPLRRPRLARPPDPPLLVLEVLPADRPPHRRDDRQRRTPRRGREGARHRDHLRPAARPEGGALGPALPRRLGRRPSAPRSSAAAPQPSPPSRRSPAGACSAAAPTSPMSSTRTRSPRPSSRPSSCASLASDAPRHHVRPLAGRRRRRPAERQLRIAFANVGVDGLRTLGERLRRSARSPPRACRP